MTWVGATSGTEDIEATVEIEHQPVFPPYLNTRQAPFAVRLGEGETLLRRAVSEGEARKQSVDVRAPEEVPIGPIPPAPQQLPIHLHPHNRLPESQR